MFENIVMVHQISRGGRCIYGNAFDWRRPPPYTGNINGSMFTNVAVDQSCRNGYFFDGFECFNALNFLNCARSRATADTGAWHAMRESAPSWFGGTISKDQWVSVAGGFETKLFARRKTGITACPGQEGMGRSENAP